MPDPFTFDAPSTIRVHACSGSTLAYGTSGINLAMKSASTWDLVNCPDVFGLWRMAHKRYVVIIVIEWDWK